jgi:phage gp29-like protein
MAEFLMLGSGSGSYALSKTKTDLFLRSLESYINSIVDVLNKQLVERLWQLNGLSWETMPKLVAGDVAPHDLREIAAFLRNINGAGIELNEQVEVVEDLMNIAEIDFDPAKYEAKVQERKAQQSQDSEIPA